jgi:hypothetical protein
VIKPVAPVGEPVRGLGPGSLKQDTRGVVREAIISSTYSRPISAIRESTTRQRRDLVPLLGVASSNCRSGESFEKYCRSSSATISSGGYLVASAAELDGITGIIAGLNYQSGSNRTRGSCFAIAVPVRAARPLDFAEGVKPTTNSTELLRAKGAIVATRMDRRIESFFPM